MLDGIWQQLRDELALQRQKIKSKSSLMNTIIRIAT